MLNTTDIGLNIDACSEASKMKTLSGPTTYCNCKSTRPPGWVGNIIDTGK